VISTKDGVRGARRRTRAGITTAVAIFAAAALASPAGASLTAAGPVDPASLPFPTYYQDSTGLQIGLCIEDPLCPASPKAADMVGPDGEAFYQLATATVDGAGASVTVDFDVEAAFLDAQTPITFGRIQFTATGLVPNATYTVEHPYGTSHFTVGANGNLTGGARAAQREETDGSFDGTLGSPIGPFLRNTGAPAGYLGNGVTANTVTGGSVRNTVRVFGPGLPPAVTDVNGVIITPAGLSTDQFTVEGRFFDPNAPLPPAPVPVPPDADRDGVIDSVDNCVNQQGPASNNGCPLPVVVDNTKQTPPAQVVERTSVQRVLSASVRSLSVSRLALARRISITRLRVQGLRTSMRVQDGTNVVRIAIYKARNGKKTGRALYVTTRAPRKSGLYRVTLRSRSLLSKLRAGSYVMEVRSGSSAAALGTARSIGFTVTR
jgi:hypothetical protein